MNHKIGLINNRKGGVPFYTSRMFWILLVIAVIFIALWPQLNLAENTFFEVLGLKGKCKETGVTLKYYEETLASFFKNPDPARNREIRKLCDDCELCFPEEYKKFKDNCDSLVIEEGELKTPFCKGENDVTVVTKKCLCNSAKLWTSEGNEWKSFDPPCTRTTRSYFYMDDSLSITEENEEDFGACILYYSTRYYIAIYNDGADKKLWSELYWELSDYGHTGLYMDKVCDSRICKDELIRKEANSEIIITRKGCFKIAEAQRAMIYPIFYTSWVDNLYHGNLDDKGICITFPTGDSCFYVDTDYTREDCISGDRFDSKSSFFVVDIGSREYKRPVEEKISTYYSSDFTAKDRSTVSEEYVKEKCGLWYKYDLTFVTGVESEGGYRGEKLTDRSSACNREAVFVKNQGFMDNNYNRVAAEQSGDGKNICCYYKNRKAFTADDIKSLMYPEYKEKLIAENEKKISTRYSSDYYAQEEVTISKEEVQEKCVNWQEYDLTFKTGTILSGTYKGSTESLRENACTLEMRKIKATGFIKNDYDHIASIEVGENEICCYTKNPVEEPEEEETGTAVCPVKPTTVVEEREKEKKISTSYSLNLNAIDPEDSLTVEMVKNSCWSWDQYDLTFATGTIVNGEYKGASESSRIRACKYEINKNIIKTDLIDNLYAYADSYELNNGKDICCYANNPND